MKQCEQDRRIRLIAEAKDLGKEQVVRNAEPHFRLVEAVSGRLDYIETIRQWRKRFAEPSLRKTLLKLELLPRWLTNADFRLAFTSGVSANGVCFERQLLDLVSRLLLDRGDPVELHDADVLDLLHGLDGRRHDAFDTIEQLAPALRRRLRP